MNNDLTLLVVVLDRSGSMDVIAEDMSGGLNTYIKEQAALPGECKLTLAQFDARTDRQWANQNQQGDWYELVCDYINIKDAPKFALIPRGGTALFDAVGMTVTTVGERLAKLQEHERPHKVIVMIITDGQENSSHDWTQDRVKALVEQQKNTYGWEFMYLGANQDAVLVGTGMGVSRGSTMTYTPSSRGVANTYASASMHTNTSRVSGQSLNSQSFTQEERDKALEPDNKPTTKSSTSSKRSKR